MLVLSLTAAALWGTGNFALGFSVRRSSPRTTVLVGFSASLLAALIYLVLQQPVPRAGAFFWGALAGVCQGAGWLCFAHSIERTSLAVAAPAAATTTTVTLLVIDAVLGHPLSALSVLGFAVSLAALAVFSRPASGQRLVAATDGRWVGLAGLAGLAFAGQSRALVGAGTSSAALVLVGTSCGVVALLGTTTLARRVPLRPTRTAVAVAAGGGTIIFLGDAAYLFALHRGVPALASVVAQMHPLVTAVLAMLLLRDRLSRSQMRGLVLAMAGVALVGLGR